MKRNKAKNCRQCGKKLPDTWSTNICLECSKANIRETFQKFPAVREAFREAIEEMKKPENIEFMAEDTVKIIREVLAEGKETEYGKAEHI